MRRVRMRMGRRVRMRVRRIRRFRMRMRMVPRMRMRRVLRPRSRGGVWSSREGSCEGPSGPRAARQAARIRASQSV
jgi:hypothetical protein